VKKLLSGTSLSPAGGLRLPGAVTIAIRLSPGTVTVILRPVVVGSPPTVILLPVVVWFPSTVIILSVVVGIASKVVLTPVLPSVAQVLLHGCLSVAHIKGLP
jgi:hypothetical protein